MQFTAASGLELSPYQLERWRTAGLIPRPGPDTLVRIGNTKVYPPETAVLVAGLLVCAPLCRTNGDLALLAFFNEVPVPSDPVRSALLKNYFPQYSKSRKRESEALQRIPAEHREKDRPWYDWAEAAAALDMENKAAVQQMRDNLRRRCDGLSMDRTWPCPRHPWPAAHCLNAHAVESWPPGDEVGLATAPRPARPD